MRSNLSMKKSLPEPQEEKRSTAGLVQILASLNRKARLIMLREWRLSSGRSQGFNMPYTACSSALVPNNRETIGN